MLAPQIAVTLLRDVFTRQLSAMTIMLVLPIAATLLRAVFTLQ